MEHFLKLRPAVRAYVATVVLVGLFVLVLSVGALFAEPIGSEWLLLATLTILTGSFSVKVPSINAYISVSEAFVFASVLLFGAEAGTVTVLLECLVILLWMKPQGRPVYRALFNLAAPSVAIWSAGTAFYWLSGIAPYSEVFTPLPRLFLPLLAFTAAYFLLNSWLVAVAVGLETQRSPLGIWWKNFAWLSVNYFSGASVAALIVTYTQRLDFSTLAVIVPLLVVSYLTFRTAMGRAEDSYNHLAELNRLYLSTIETLAMAIDAKDQITHGHIRRVQIYAVGLAGKLGVTDDRLLKAIEAAALLHDMGKLAVPEHILNKPGKLTAAEFEKMKLHAAVGADILSAIDFPYPVVPIVRHHHENWDGTGYPDGIRGTDIPIGARILSVVDCFDALTSDRPYRPKLSDESALAILEERRGTMYDPLVVDTFVRVHKDIAPEKHESLTLPEHALAGITSAKANESDSRGGGGDSASKERLPASFTVALADQGAGLKRALSILAKEVAPSHVAIVYRHERTSDRLVPFESVEPTETVGLAPTIALGERLSGWVGANRRSILNSDPMLDLGDGWRSTDVVLAYTLSVPLLLGRELEGVLSLYSSLPYTEAQKELVEDAAHFIAHRLQTDGDRHRAPEVSSAQTTHAPVSSVLCVEILNWVQIATSCTPGERELIMSDAAGVLRAHLGSTDLLVRYRESEFVLLLSPADAKDVRALARRIRMALSDLKWSSQPAIRLEISVDSMVAPVSADSIWEYLTKPNRRAEDRNLAGVSVH